MNERIAPAIDLGVLGFDRPLSLEEQRAIAAQSLRLRAALADRRDDLFALEPSSHGLALLRGAAKASLR